RPAHPPPPVPAGSLLSRPPPATDPPSAAELPRRHLWVVGPPPEPLPFDHPEPTGEPGRRSLERPLDFFDPQPTSRWELPPPHEWLRQLLRGLLECLEGWRPARQLRRYAVPGGVGLAAAHCKPVARARTAPRSCPLHP